jgi:hypothetical protein
VNSLTIGHAGGQQPTNTAIGYQALQSNTTGQYNTSVGYNSTHGNTSGSYNTAIGYNAGSNSSNNNNTYLGYNTTSSSSGASSSTAIGQNSQITTSNQIVLGTTAETVSLIGGLIDIPTYKAKTETTNLGYQGITTGSFSVTGTGIPQREITHQLIPSGVWNIVLSNKIVVTSGGNMNVTFLEFGLSTTSNTFDTIPYSETIQHSTSTFAQGDNPTYNSSYALVLAGATTIYSNIGATTTNDTFNVSGALIYTRIA